MFLTAVTKIHEEQAGMKITEEQAGMKMIE